MKQNGKHKAELNGKSTPKVKEEISKLTGVKFKPASDLVDYSAPWHCNTCGKRYYRRDKYEGWAPVMIKGVPILHHIRLRQCLVCSKPRKMAMLNVFGGTT